MKGMFRKFGGIVENRHRWVVLTSILFIVVALIGAQNIEMASGYETMISTDSHVYKDYQRFNNNFGGDVIVVMVSGNDLPELLQPDNLKAYRSVEKAIGDAGKYPDIITVLSPAMLIEQAMEIDPTTIEDTGTVLATVVDPDTGQIRPSFGSVLPDSQHALISIIIKPELESDRVRDIVKGIDQAIAQANFTEGTGLIITGMPVAMSDIEDLMMTNLSQMFLLAIGLLLVVLTLIFKVRGVFAWRWLPLGVVLVGTLYTFGLMGFLGVGLTMVTMAVFPILIGLGIDYGIQVHNRYDEEILRGRSAADALIDSITHMGPSIGIALVAGCMGFAALFFSPVPMIQDFGLLLIVGVIAAYLVAMFPLAGFLYHHDRDRNDNPEALKKKSSATQNNKGIVEKAIVRVAPWVIHNPWIIIPLALAPTFGGLFADSHIGTVTDETVFVNEDMAPMRNLNALREVAGGTTTLNLLFESETDIITPETLNWMDDFETYLVGPESGNSDAIAASSSIAQLIKQQNGGVIPQTPEEIDGIVMNLPESMSKNLISHDRKAANMTLTLVPMNDEQTGDMVDRLQQAILTRKAPGDVHASLTGVPVIMQEVVDAITGGRQTMTALGLVFIFIILMLLFGLRPMRAILATLPILMIIGWAALVMYAMGIDFTPLTATLGALTMGVGVEYTILVMGRYYEERDNGEPPVEAMTTALARIGRAVTVSAFTTMGGFAALLIATDFPILQDFGIITLLNVLFALIVSMVVLPPMIVKYDTLSENYPILKRL